MLLLYKESEKETDFFSNRSEINIKNREAHEHNACVRVKDTGLIYDAIRLAQHKNTHQWRWQYDQAECHPAILTLCAFWHCFCEQQPIHEARIPYIQLFFGGETYTPLISNAPTLSVELEDAALQHTIKKTSVLFGDVFLVSFLAGREVSARKSQKDSLIYYTAYDQPLFKEPLLFYGESREWRDLQNQLAWKVLNALHYFPKRFPRLWQQLKQQHENPTYEMH